MACMKLEKTVGKIVKLESSNDQRAARGLRILGKICLKDAELNSDYDRIF